VSGPIEWCHALVFVRQGPLRVASLGRFHDGEQFFSIWFRTSGRRRTRTTVPFGKYFPDCRQRGCRRGGDPPKFPGPDDGYSGSWTARGPNRLAGGAAPPFLLRNPLSTTNARERSARHERCLIHRSSNAVSVRYLRFQCAEAPFFSNSGQLTTTVIGSDTASSNGWANRNRLPSAETSYCRGFKSNSSLVWNRGSGAPSLRLAGASSTDTAIILPLRRSGIIKWTKWSVNSEVTACSSSPGVS